MEKQSIIEFLEDNNLTDIEEVEIDAQDEVIAIKFFYDFDKDEISAAKSYASEETDYDENDTQWIATGIIPYLNDLAYDNVSEINEDLMEEFELIAKFKAEDISTSDYTYQKFYLILTEDDSIDLEDIIDNL
ncbi:hypothetical protein [Clostridium massiliamazoniense]|uniref:hypothetical protein n=1 Tax=Clostridium massiliamazoniense TaxID=1347366 RepID=UPI0006D78B3B|nr:hypothetical protein [Clostridium massiliamazoniense]